MHGETVKFEKGCYEYFQGLRRKQTMSSAASCPHRKIKALMFCGVRGLVPVAAGGGGGGGKKYDFKFKKSSHGAAMISGSLSPRHGASSGCGWRNGLQYGG